MRFRDVPWASVNRSVSTEDNRGLTSYTVNWYFESKLNFYNDDVDMLKMPKPPQRPVKSKYETKEQHHGRVKEWEAKKPLPIERSPGGHHMTQEYYTKELLPKCITAVQRSHMHNTLEITTCLSLRLYRT
ncbi:hypothetical protein EJ02DRAFT_427848 [Clathrospora elynae]|uniref:Uncharacterized protein n=1 Tax=Clathrospora elynae TaxID=706981 RepID=A0A6A5S7Q5_9PLEO|nr:hypothetical protein EJ02DRAFT_427848 [Clathrospora elynae]